MNKPKLYLALLIFACAKDSETNLKKRLDEYFTCIQKISVDSLDVNQKLLNEVETFIEPSIARSARAKDIYKQNKSLNDMLKEYGIKSFSRKTEIQKIEINDNSAKVEIVILDSWVDKGEQKEKISNAVLDWVYTEGNWFRSVK